MNERAIREILKKIKIQIDGQTISKEQLLVVFGNYLIQTLSNSNHTVGLVMHTGSICFDAILVTYVTLLNLISNKAETEDVINSFSEGDVVLYGAKKKSRFVFEGFIDGADLGVEKGLKYIKLAQGESSATFVPKKLWRNIEPYNGNSVRMDGRGIRKKTIIRDDFFVEVLGYEQENIPSILDASCVIVVPRERADYLVKNISLVFNEKQINLLDLVTASYYTEEDEYRYGGNTGKNEPTLKFTSKVSAARPLLLSKRGNRHLGIIVLGEDSISRGYYELLELINRKSLQYVYACSSMDSDLGLELTTDVEETEIFACTKEFLLENSSFDNIEENDYITELAMQVNTIIKKNNELVILDENGIEKETFIEFKKNIIAIKRDEYSTDGKDNFIIHSYSLMNLFITAPFPMDRFFVTKERGLIEVNTPEGKIAELQRLSNDLPKHLQKHSSAIIKILKKILDREEKTNGKFDWLSNYLHTHFEEKTAIVVPKAYYVTLIKESGLFSDQLFKNKTFITANRFDNSKKYECVIVLGDYDGKSFNVFRSNAAARIISVIYECEKAGYYYKYKLYQNRINFLQKKSTIVLSVQDDVELMSSEEEDAAGLEKEIEDYISHVDLPFLSSAYKNNTDYEGSVNTDIVAVAVFDDETKAYFSKHYKGYVLEETTGIVKEVGAQEFCEGDSIVFTKNNDDAKDIVSSILEKLFLDDRLDAVSEENYRKANLWKNSLIDFMYAKKYTARRVAELMHEDGATVHEQTILNWLDEDSHTVGPRMVDSIRHIGNITGIEELKNNPEIIFEACREIRSIRRKILDQVGMAIVDKLSGRIPKSGTDMESIFEKVDSLAEIKRVEHITRVEMVVPIGMANRPISV